MPCAFLPSLAQLVPLAQQDAAPLIDFSFAPLWEDTGIPLAVMGILVVFVALMLVVLFITILPHALSSVSLKSPVLSEPEPVKERELPEETLVVIAAAVAIALREPHRIVRIRGQAPEDLGWSLEGRMQHHRSHSIQRDRR